MRYQEINVISTSKNNEEQVLTHSYRQRTTFFFICSEVSKLCSSHVHLKEPWKDLCELLNVQVSGMYFMHLYFALLTSPGRLLPSGSNPVMTLSPPLTSWSKCYFVTYSFILNFTSPVTEGALPVSATFQFAYCAGDRGSTSNNYFIHNGCNILEPATFNLLLKDLNLFIFSR